MSIGIGLGSFMDSFQRGLAARESLDRQRVAREHRNELKQIETDTRAQFDKQVADGQATPEQFEKFWLDYALPKRRNALLRQGDVAGARALQEWGESDEARKGGKLFASALIKAQTGDPAGALKDAISASKIKGYMDTGFEFVSQDELQDTDGNLLGYRIKLKDAEGREIEQDVKVDDVPRIISTFANPEAAWQSQQEARKKVQERKEGIEDFTVKEGIKTEFAIQRDKAKPSAAEEPTKVYDAARKQLADEGGFEWEDMPEEERHQRTLDYMRQRESARGGQTAPGLAPDQMVVDTQTGAAVPNPSDATVAPGLGESPRQQQKAPAAQPKAAPAAAQQAPAAPPPDRQSMINEASVRMREGGNPFEIARALSAAGVEQQQFPQELQKALRDHGRAPGLGG